MNPTRPTGAGGAGGARRTISEREFKRLAATRQTGAQTPARLTASLQPEHSAAQTLRVGSPGAHWQVRDTTHAERDLARHHPLDNNALTATTLLLMARDLFVVGVAAAVAAASRGTLSSQLCEEAQECTWRDFRLVAALTLVVMPLYALAASRGTRLWSGTLPEERREGVIPDLLAVMPHTVFGAAQMVGQWNGGLPGAAAVTARAVGRLAQTAIRDILTQAFTRASHLRPNSLYPGHNLALLDADGRLVERTSLDYRRYLGDRLKMATALYTVVAVTGAMLAPTLRDAMETVPTRERFPDWLPEEFSTAIISTTVEVLDQVTGAVATLWAASKNGLQLQLDDSPPPAHPILHDILDHAALRTQMTAPLDLVGAIVDAHQTSGTARIFSGILLGLTEPRGYIASTGRAGLAQPANRAVPQPPPARMPPGPKPVPAGGRTLRSRAAAVADDLAPHAGQPRPGPLEQKGSRGVMPLEWPAQVRKARPAPRLPGRAVRSREAAEARDVAPYAGQPRPERLEQKSSPRQLALSRADAEAACRRQERVHLAPGYDTGTDLQLEANAYLPRLDKLWCRTSCPLESDAVKALLAHHTAVEARARSDIVGTFLLIPRQRIVGTGAGVRLTNPSGEL